MATLSPKFLDTLRKHLELGTSVRHLAMSEDQKKRVRICLEVYNLRKQNPYLDISAYLTNKYGRTYWEIRADRECLDFICSVLDAGGKNIARTQVLHTYEKAAKIAWEQGDHKGMISAGKHISDLMGLTEPEQGEDLENSIAKLAPVYTPDARKVLPGKTYSDSRALDRIRAKWGVKKDGHQEMVDVKTQELLEKVSTDSSGADGAGFDLSSLDENQLAALQRAVSSRLQESRAAEIDDEDENEDQ